MATKMITELTRIDSVQDIDLLVIETSDGTRAITKEDLFKGLTLVDIATGEKCRLQINNGVLEVV